MTSLVSIITPTFNSQEYLLETYKSILKQTYQNWEWIVTDDYSQDSTISMLLQISREDPRVKLFKNNKNYGAAITRNCSLRNAKGCFIAFIDSDDMWTPKKLELQIAFMEKSNLDFSFTSFAIVKEDGIASGKIVDNFSTRSFSYFDMLKKEATLGCSTVILRRNAYKDISMPLIRTGQDYALWLKLLKSGGVAVLFPETLTKYRILPNSISRNKLKKAMRQWQIYRKIQGLNLFYSIYLFFHYGYRAVFRR